ncbi:hypothetical protein LSH36_25g07025 [Paralvinella palmiformis]|uniref:Uncharacterized protein n=1 Tax=Paralvinella palmiformis TaxID=53620 RepID=A0AAD9KAT7_9ANNE|nr:hypothetical protein LSH36_25g07025 [Paralvinella palmiformis]
MATITTHSPHPTGLNSETAMTLSQSMDSVNTSPEEEVGLLMLFFLNQLIYAKMMMVMVVGRADYVRGRKLPVFMCVMAVCVCV